MDGDVSACPKPLKPTKPVSSAPLVPRDPSSRQAFIPRTTNRQEKQAGADVEKTSDTRQKPDSYLAASGESGVCVSRVPSFHSRKPAPKGTPANREGTSTVFFLLFFFNAASKVSYRFY